MLLFYDKRADEREYIYFVRYGKDKPVSKSVIKHFHNSVELCFIVSGHCLLTVNGAEHHLYPGMIAFMNCFEAHNYMPDDDSEYYVVLISSEFFDGVNNLGGLSFPTIMDNDKSFDTVKSFLDYSYGMWAGANTAIKFGFVNMLLGIMTSLYPTVEKPRSMGGELFVRVLKYVSENLSSDLSVAALAAHFGYTPNYFSTLFNKFLGMSFRDYLNRCRIAEYHRIIKGDPAIPRLKAAAEVGFRSPNTFYRALKKEMEEKS
jgi:AraC-like DNA-binding protein